MNQSLQHLPESKQEELQLLTQLLSSFKEVEMVILFGSYARGNWVEEEYIEKGTRFSYLSDYDMLVVLTHDDTRQKFRIEGKVNTELRDTGKVKTAISLIFHSIKHLNKALTMGNYFFKDIKKEGVLLYDSEKFKLAIPKKLTSEQYRQKAQEYFDQWFTSANGFLIDFANAIKRKDFYKAAFYLHQSVEQFYTTILLIFTDYRPKDHNLETLGIKVEMCDKCFAVFPKSNKEEERLFELLKKAYIDARYKMDEYAITKTELDYLSEKVQQLKLLTEEICKEKIREIGEG